MDADSPAELVTPEEPSAAAAAPRLTAPPQVRTQRVSRRIAARIVASDLLCLAALALVLSASGGISGLAIVLVMVCSFGALAARSLYATARRPDPGLIDEGRAIFGALLAGTAVGVLASVPAEALLLDRRLAFVLAIALPVTATAALGLRQIIRRVVRRAQPERIMIIGTGEIGQRLAHRLAADPGRRVVGFVDEDPCRLSPALEGIPLYSGAGELSLAVASLRPDRIVIAFTRRTAAEVLDDLRASGPGGVPISVVPRYHELTPAHAEMSEIAGMPFIDIHSARLSRGARTVKRAFDVTLAGVGLVLLAPLMVAAAVAVRVTSRGPILFAQPRTGQDGRTFRIWKFRTMHRNAERLRMELADLNDMDSSAPLFKIRNDPRVTSVGRILRKYSIDELPQLFNVVGGTMSLVGPRPFVVHEADQMQGWARHRLDLPPGITGVWQVRGRNDVSYEEMVRLDYMYVANWSPLWDLRLILETIPRVLSGRGAS